MEYIKPNICARCGNSWHGRDPNIKPKHCSRCHANNWGVVGHVAFAKKYGIETIRVGGSKAFEVRDQDKASVASSVSRYGKAKGSLFRLTHLPNGFIVIRIS